MFDSILTDLVADVSLNPANTILCLLVALLLGLIISILYLIVTPRHTSSSNLALSLVVLPTIISVVILLVGSNLARAFSMAGVFALIRFRSVPGDSKDITFVFMSMAAGLSAGLGYIIFGVAVTVILCLTVLVISKLGFGVSKHSPKRLRIIIPEDMNFQGVFDDLFVKYTKQYKLSKIKTTNLGTLFELTYQITMKEESQEKEFIDELRCRNGNLNILMTTDENSDTRL